jgi:hypothetical protein
MVQVQAQVVVQLELRVQSQLTEHVSQQRSDVMQWTALRRNRMVVAVGGASYTLRGEETRPSPRRHT